MKYEKIVANFARETPSHIPYHNLDGKILINDERFNQSMKVGYTGDKELNDYIFSDAEVNGNIFGARALEYQHAKVFEVVHKMIKYRSIWDILNFNNPGYESHTYQVTDQVGEAKLIGSDVNDLPRCDISGRTVNAPIAISGCAYGVTRKEMAAASLTNFSVIQGKSRSCMRATEQLFDKVAFVGDEEAKLGGLLNNTDISISDVPNGAGGFPEWTTKTPDEITRDVIDMYNEVVEASDENFIPDTIAMPIAQYNYIKSLRMATGTDTTVLTFLLNNLDGLTRVIPANRLKGAGAGGSDVMFAFDSDSSVSQYGLGFELAFLDPEFSGLSMIVNAWAGTAGLMVYQPLGYTIREKI